MRIHIITIFPEMIDAALGYGVVGRAVEAKRLDVRAVNLRDFTSDRHRTTDDTPCGGGGGMVMKPEPLECALNAIRREGEPERVILTDPQGQKFTQRMAEELARCEELVFLCGRYEGVDERVRMRLATDVLSIGDYVLSGGELPALVMVDAIARLIPGVLGCAESPRTETFAEGLLDYPQFTRPRTFAGVDVPEVLLAGDHQEIQRWRRWHQLDRTRRMRPDLWAEHEVTLADLRLLAAGPAG